MTTKTIVIDPSNLDEFKNDLIFSLQKTGSDVLRFKNMCGDAIFRKNERELSLDKVKKALIASSEIDLSSEEIGKRASRSLANVANEERPHIRTGIAGRIMEQLNNEGYSFLESEKTASEVEAPRTRILTHEELIRIGNETAEFIASKKSKNISR